MTTTAVATKGNSKKIKDIISGDEFNRQVAMALPKHLTPDRFVRVALTAINRTPKLAQCTQSSLFQCLLDLSSLGIEPDGRRAHLIPFDDRKNNRTICTLILDYKGIAELVLRSGEVSYIHADVVCENDDFSYNMGQIEYHRIDMKQPRGDMYAAYAMAKMKSGDIVCKVMSRDEIDAIRKRSRSGRFGPWVTDYNEMAKKTIFRNLSKWLPLSPELRDRVEVDDKHQFESIGIEQVETNPLKEAQDRAAMVGVDASECKTAKEVDDLIAQSEDIIIDVSEELPEESAPVESSEDMVARAIVAEKALPEDMVAKLRKTYGIPSDMAVADIFAETLEKYVARLEKKAEQAAEVVADA